MIKNKKCVLVISVFLLIISCKKESPTSPSEEPLGFTSVGTPAQSLTEFDGALERIRIDLKIPGFSAAITKSGKIVWAKGFGYANKKELIKATPETVYHLASLTKPFAATIIMQLIEENKLSLETPISDFGLDLGNSGIIRVKHLLSHSSEGVPGTHYNYNGSRFSNLDSVIHGVSEKSFCELLNEKIILPLNLTMTAPYLVANNCINNEQALTQLASGYSPNGQDIMFYPIYFGTAAGLISNVIDMSNFSIAIDNDLLLKTETKALMFSPTISNDGTELPYGLGWFVDTDESVNIIWHYGYWDAISTLILKVPEKELSFIILANSDRLSSASQGIGSDENVNHSVVAQEFINAFVNGTAQLPDIPFTN